MPKRARALTAVEVARLREPGRHWVGGAEGLMLLITTAGTRFWVCRVAVNGKRPDVRLGRYPEMSLSQARDAVHEVHRAIRDGRAPKAYLEPEPESAVPLPVPKPSRHTFKQAAKEFMDFKEKEWKNLKHRKQWRSTLATYAYPVIGNMDVSDIELEHVLKVIKPIWLTTTETASRVRGRIEAVLDYATVMKWRRGDNPARWRGRLDKTLPAKGKVSRVRHHPALPFEEMPAFMQRLKQAHGVSARALHLLILTAVRSNEIRHARWHEFNLETGTWTISAERMKSDREHVVPLSRQALALLASLPRVANDQALLFPNRAGHAISDMAMTKLMRDWELEARPHGFRSTFEDWVGDETEYDGELSDAALAHKIKCKTKAAYRRKTAVKRRRPVMQEWADAIEPDDPLVSRHQMNVDV